MILVSVLRGSPTGSVEKFRDEDEEKDEEEKQVVPVSVPVSVPVTVPVEPFDSEPVDEIQDLAERLFRMTDEDEIERTLESLPESQREEVQVRIGPMVDGLCVGTCDGEGRI